MKAFRMVGIPAALVAVLLAAAVLSSPANAMFGRTRDVVNITDAPVSTGSGAVPTLQDVEGAIRRAAVAHRWVVSKVEDGHLQADLTVDRHFIKVDIAYSTTAYSITYNDSRVMLYDGKQIHKNYNRWVGTLSDQIRLEISQL